MPVNLHLHGGVLRAASQNEDDGKTVEAEEKHQRCSAYDCRKKSRQGDTEKGLHLVGSQGLACRFTVSVKVFPVGGDQTHDNREVVERMGQDDGLERVEDLQRGFGEIEQ
ncbi:hypothetical protein SDC9_90643 [bioreactor metagenome]|uniref:Uncharacterized protein n=1 Tax=bioreactor metagenome TaxID=1076179 RepID=A0A644ZSV4_9ZZZZ